jgi:hypothetical protein
MGHKLYVMPSVYLLSENWKLEIVRAEYELHVPVFMYFSGFHSQTAIDMCQCVQT